MKFSCGYSDAGRKLRKKALEEWHPFFTILPRTVGEEGTRSVCAMFEWIERKGYYCGGWDGCVWFWTYRERTKETSYERW